MAYGDLPFSGMSFPVPDVGNNDLVGNYQCIGYFFLNL